MYYRGLNLVAKESISLILAEYKSLGWKPRTTGFAFESRLTIVGIDSLTRARLDRNTAQHIRKAEEQSSP